MDFVCDFSEFSLNSGKCEFIFKATSKTEIDEYIKNMNPNKNVRSDVPSIRLVKIEQKLFLHIFLNCITNLLSTVCFLSPWVVPIYKNS